MLRLITVIQKKKSHGNGDEGGELGSTKVALRVTDLEVPLGQDLPASTMRREPQPFRRVRKASKTVKDGRSHTYVPEVPALPAPIGALSRGARIPCRDQASR